jgi:hypothetical protein
MNADKTMFIREILGRVEGLIGLLRPALMSRYNISADDFPSTWDELIGSINQAVAGLREDIEDVGSDFDLIEDFERTGDFSLSAHQELEEMLGDRIENPHAVCESSTGESPPSCLKCGEHLFDHAPLDDDDSN